MKRSEIAAIIAIAATSIAVAYFVANALIGKPSSTPVKVRTTTQISAEVDQPDSKVFNKDAINPTVEVVIGNE
jgi:hypothetical protein